MPNAIILALVHYKPLLNNMLSYRHAFHAGNHADVLKHLVLFLVLNYYNRKDKPYICIDTHAGAGYYDLGSQYAQKTGEHQQGISLLRHNEDIASPLLNEFVAFIDGIVDHNSQYYPGSPLIAAKLLRQQDYLRLCELHSSDAALLHQTMQTHHINVRYSINHEDGLRAALGWLPPPNHRAVVLTDPSYEVKTDYHAVHRAFINMHRRCREACMILWYPLLHKGAQVDLLSNLERDFNTNSLRVELCVRNQETIGMYGSGLFIINPPYILAEQLQTILPELTKLLAQDDHSSYQIKHNH